MVGESKRDWEERAFEVKAEVVLKCWKLTAQWEFL